MADLDIVDGENAVYYDSNNIDNLIEKLAFYLEHEKGAEELAKAGTALYNQKYTWERFGQILYGFMKSPLKF